MLTFRRETGISGPSRLLDTAGHRQRKWRRVLVKNAADVYDRGDLPMKFLITCGFILVSYLFGRAFLPTWLFDDKKSKWIWSAAFVMIFGVVSSIIDAYNEEDLPFLPFLLAMVVSVVILMIAFPQSGESGSK